MENSKTISREKGSKTRYSNFNNLGGLLFRMLKSWNRAAYFTLFREGLSILLIPVDFILAPIEKRLLKKQQKSELPVILILGGSRSGTTLLYQVLSDLLPVSYFTNLSSSFPRAPITSSKILSRVLRKRKTNYKNYFGNISGFNAPNEGFHIWNRWFGKNRGEIKGALSDSKIVDMRNFLLSWNSVFSQPLINKNNRNSLAIELFESALPKQFFYLIIERDPIYVVQSLLLSREMVQGDKRKSWGLAGENSTANIIDSSDPLVHIDHICDQVFRVNANIDKSLLEVNPDRYLRIKYENFCDCPREVVQKIANLVFYKGINIPQLEKLKPFKNTNRQRVTNEEFNRILKSVANLNRTLSQE